MSRRSLLRSRRGAECWLAIPYFISLANGARSVEADAFVEWSHKSEAAMVPGETAIFNVMPRERADAMLTSLIAHCDPPLQSRGDLVSRAPEIAERFGAEYLIKWREEGEHVAVPIPFSDAMKLRDPGVCFTLMRVLGFPISSPHALSPKNLELLFCAARAFRAGVQARGVRSKLLAKKWRLWFTQPYDARAPPPQGDFQPQMPPPDDQSAWYTRLVNRYCCFMDNQPDMQTHLWSEPLYSALQATDEDEPLDNDEPLDIPWAQEALTIVTAPIEVVTGRSSAQEPLEPMGFLRFFNLPHASSLPAPSKWTKCSGK